MPEIKVVNMAGKEVGKMNLSDRVFAAEVNAPVLHLSLIHISLPRVVAPREQAEPA